jgi:hypothetical protein
MSVRRVLTASRVLRTGGLKFDGVDDYVEVPDSLSLRLPTEFTAMVWVKALFSPGQNPIVVNKGSNNPKSTNYAILQTTGNTFDAYVGKYDGSAFATARFGSLPLNEWHHLAMTFTTSELTLYLDGSYKASASTGWQAYTSTRTLRIADLWGYYFNGFIGEVRIYNRALSQDEITRIYNTGEIIRDGLVLLLDFSEYEGSIAYDKSSLGNHGTIYGAEWVIKKAERVVSI